MEKLLVSDLIRRAKFGAALSGNNDQLVKLLSALEPYGYGNEELNELCEYEVDEETFEEELTYFECDSYSMHIYPTYMYRVNGWYIYVTIKDSLYANRQSAFYISNTNDKYLMERIKTNTFTKSDFIRILERAKDYINKQYPGIFIDNYIIHGENGNYTYDTIMDLEMSNESFSGFHSVLNSDT